MKDFLVRYVTHEGEPWRKFGLLHDPAKFEGGGCVSFGMAMAEHGGLLRRPQARLHPHHQGL